MSATARPISAVRGEEFSRSFTNSLTDFGDWSQIEPLYARLEEEIQSIQTPAELEAWLLRRSELGAALSEEYSRRNIASTCQTDGPAAEKAFLHFLENILPKLRPWEDRLNRAYLQNPARSSLDRQRLAVHDRVIERDVELFREENVPLKTEEQKLAKEYLKITGAMTVHWRGEERTLQQMAPVLEETDRSTREAAWQAMWQRRLQDRERIEAIMDELIALRTRIARNAGFDNFRDYQHAAYCRFDYTPDDCIAFQHAIETEVVPLLKRLREKRRQELAVESLRPWDLDVDPQGRQPLVPFHDAAELEEKVGRIFAALNRDLGAEYQIMRDRGLLDLASRKGKAPGGYCDTLQEVRLPFIFMNAAGTNDDVMTMLHEGGHAFHAFATRTEPLLPYRENIPIEFCEVASMSLEIFGLDHLSLFYDNPEDVARAREGHFEGLLGLFPWIATIDAFQHWLYLNPQHTHAEREAAWLDLCRRFAPVVDWSGLEDAQRSLWQRQLHLFKVPFYYVEYGIAQVGALQLWLNYQNDPAATLEAYRRALALGGSRPLPELFAAAGARFDFTRQTLRPIMEQVARELRL